MAASSLGQRAAMSADAAAAASMALVGEPGFVANGVQISNVQYNPSVDGILWDVAVWTLLKPGPPGQ